MRFQGRGFGALARTDITQQELQRLGADRVRCDQLVAGLDVQPGIYEVDQGRCVDHVASHGLSLKIINDRGYRL